MASKLDEQLRSIMDRLTAPRSVFERETVVSGGQRLAAFRQAPESLPALFDRFCTQYANREFLIDGDVRLTFAEVHTLARRVAVGLIVRHGVAPGDRIGIAAANSANWIIAYMGVLMAGGCATLLNGWWMGEELVDGIALSECRIVLADADRRKRLGARATEATVIAIEGGLPEAGLASIIAEAEDNAALPRPAPLDPATVLFTSGSTGRAKAAWSDHRALVQATMNFAAQSLMLSVQLTEAGTPPGDRQTALLCVPLFHVTGEIAVLLQSFVIGRRLAIMPKWGALEAMRLIERESVTFFVGVPAMSLQIATHARRGEFDLSSCRSFAAGGSHRPVSHIGHIRKAMPGAYPMLAYGLTETNCVGCTNFNENYLDKPVSTGPASGPLVELAILAEDGTTLPPNVQGEIAIRSICNFRGYWNDPDATSAAIRADGFFLTGDLGSLDNDGYLIVCGRKKDIVIRGGENISCGEVEMEISSHPGILEASVFAVPDAQFGEVPVAAYQCRAGATVSEEDLRAHLSGRLASFKIPAQFHEHDGGLPHLASLKVDKQALKARYSKEGNSARTAA